MNSFVVVSLVFSSSEVVPVFVVLSSVPVEFDSVSLKKKFQVQPNDKIYHFQI